MALMNYAIIIINKYAIEFSKLVFMCVIIRMVSGAFHPTTGRQLRVFTILQHKSQIRVVKKCHRFYTYCHKIRAFTITQ